MSGPPVHPSVELASLLGETLRAVVKAAVLEALEEHLGECLQQRRVEHLAARIKAMEDIP